ncbi:hypothetical protein PR003_g10462 [Phytophthora rubi]|uniref:RxLR effector protein n=1 Tax=Phytophthora rubi TaxID=129364 RepID=A0A6A4FJV5_9STRA|nr:hypothetical protein PR002_g10244 [Phytophthora rubi]KAE9033835.1 hypothetical protein PR001_g9992 [Phytophthora rubi]KAE9340500.1 hypothetical protein PR003_g10462 [Phytophthora rubi]
MSCSRRLVALVALFTGAGRGDTKPDAPTTHSQVLWPTSGHSGAMHRRWLRV